MKKFFAMLLAVTMLATSAMGAMACTAIYAGANMTADGSVIFGRSEDYAADYNKLFFAIPAGVHTAGEEYAGCYGFTWTFTHDSYGYTAFQDDNLLGICPDCDSEHAHTPYQAAGTNEKGVSMTATETLYGNEAVAAADPFPDNGIEEAEIPTVLLSECATAKEALDLLMNIYATTGANGGSGIIIADASEAWYIENMSGTQYIAVKLNDDMLMIEPNVAIIGRIDLDDADNVIASDKLIDIAVEAGTFVGDADANVIDFAASYADGGANQRMANGLNCLNSSLSCTVESVAEADYAISNVNENGEIVAPYTNITADAKLTMDDVINFYKVPEIGKARNTETHVFQISGEGPAGTVEWVAMDNCQYSVFVPYYPMLITDTLPAYQVGTEFAARVEEQPEAGVSFANDRSGWVVYPENWKDSFYWVSAALSHIAVADETAAADIAAKLADVQAEIMVDWTDCQVAVAGVDDKNYTATEGGMAISEKAFAAVSALVDSYMK